MGGVDPEKLFSIFEQADEEVYQEHGLENLMDNPYVVIGSIVEGMENYYITDNIYLFRKAPLYREMREKVKYRYFCKLFSYLNNLDIEDVSKNYYIGESYDIQESHKALDTLRLYFEDLEEYEKCAVIVKYINLLIKQ